MKIKIKGNDYEVKNNIKAMLVFEGITDKPFEIKSMTELYQYFFAMVYANNEDFSMDFNDFLDALEDEETNQKFIDLMNGKKDIAKKKTKADK